MLEVRLLGQFEVLLGGQRLAIPTRNAQSLFAYLVLQAGRAHRRERLAGLLWPDSSEENARSNLRHELWRLRKALKPAGETYFRIDELAIAFNPNSEYTLDVQLLERVPLEESQMDDLIAALSVYQGELLPGFYEEWASSERNRLHGLFEAKMARLLELLQAERRWTEVLDWGMRWIALGGWPEPAYRALMTAYAYSGDVSKAVATYERLKQGLEKDLGVKPSGQTLALYKRIRSGWQVEGPITQAPFLETGRGTPPPGVISSDIPSPRFRRSNLPRPLTSFIGREKEIHQVEQLLSQSRLVTITGSGGVGKTRLAIQVADAEAPMYRDGIWWVELAPLFETSVSMKNHRSPGKGSVEIQEPGGNPSRRGELRGADLVAQAVSKALRVPETPGLTLVDGLLEHLGDRQMLLVLDNCEHLIEACATLVAEVLTECPQVTVLATSREALGVPGEKAWYLPSLSLPEPGSGLELEKLNQSEAVRLFVERAADVLPGYLPEGGNWLTIGQICLQLDGIPLAIELAAARMNLLSVEEIAARLDRRFNLLTAGHRTALPRQQTLLGAIDWSYDLLDEQERVLFRRLSIFSGSFSLEGVEAVCSGEGISPDEVLTLLGRLVDKSLVSVRAAPTGSDLGTRYRMLETIRSYGDLKLEGAEETHRLRESHAAYYVRLVESAEPKLMSEQQSYWYRLLKAESNNLRAVVEWTVNSDQAEYALRIIGALLWYWYYTASTREGRDLTLEALASPSAVRSNVRARALNSAGFLNCMLGDTTSARQSLEEALSILKTSNDKASLAWSWQLLGLVYIFEKKYDEADTAIKEGMALARKLGNTNINSFTFFLGDIELQKGNRSKAIRVYEESANIQRAYGNKSFLAYPLRRLGYLFLEQNDIPKAIEYFQESLVLNLEVGDMPGVTASLISFVILALYLDKPALAAQLYSLVDSRLESLSITLLYLDQAEFERLYNQLVDRLDEKALAAAYAAGWGMSIEQALELVENILI